MHHQRREVFRLESHLSAQHRSHPGRHPRQGLKNSFWILHSNHYRVSLNLLFRYGRSKTFIAHNQVLVAHLRICVANPTTRLVILASLSSLYWLTIGFVQSMNPSSPSPAAFAYPDLFFFFTAKGAGLGFCNAKGGQFGRTRGSS